MGLYHAREFRRLYPAGAAHKKRRSHLTLERLNGPAQRLTRDKNGFAGTTERACLACAAKRLKCTNIHSPPPLNMQARPLAQPCSRGPSPAGGRTSFDVAIFSHYASTENRGLDSVERQGRLLDTRRCMLTGKLAQREAEAVVHATHGRDVLIRRTATHASAGCPQMADRLARALV